jgi:hypothetical protein
MLLCDKCQHDIQIGEFPFCPHDKQANSVIGDEIDVSIKHGLCHPDGSPRRFTSRAELKREEKRRGMENHVVHIGSKGSDKSKHTTRWV